jgi:two-component system CheB/CheR fusion protein
MNKQPKLRANDLDTPLAEEDVHEFETLLVYLNTNRGFDFTGYKRSSLMRRIDKRMQTVGVEGYGNYVDYLEVHPDEFAHLFNTILINVTSFFRDPSAWDFISAEVIPRILAGKGPEAQIRIWSAGCSSGEEAFTLTMIMAEALGPQQLRDRVKIYATDIDEEALAQARLATYSAREVAGVPPALLDKYFERSGARFALSKELRRSVIFGRHDLITDAPISRVDLLVCRNALMYFNAEIQAKVLSRLHFALNNKGYMFLGKAEMLFTHANLFVPVDMKCRVFSRVTRDSFRDRVLVTAQPESEQDVSSEVNNERMREVLFDLGPVAEIAVDMAGTLALANERATRLLRLSPQDIGRPLQDLEVSYRPVELRSCIDQAHAERRPVVVKDAAWTTPSGDKGTFDVQVVPLYDRGGRFLGTSVFFNDMTRYKKLQQDLLESNRELETAYEELQSTNEELETTNEELQSTIEELETTNEELQSTNEELETMNEELQSTNEELQTINDELRLRSTELNQVNIFMESILASVRGGVVVVDEDMRIMVWNAKMEDLWGLRVDEVRDRHFLNLDIGLPADELKQIIRACLSGQNASQEIIVAARNRRGKAIQCRVIGTSLRGGDGVHGNSGGVSGAILFLEEIVGDLALAGIAS